MKMRRNKNNTPTITVPPSIPYSATVESLPASGSPSRHSVCLSPSWEAYDRRKQEKKDDKKAKEEAKVSRARPKRLSKPMPASSPYIFDQISRRNMSDTDMFNKTPTTSDRPMSMVALDHFQNEKIIYRQPRSRAGSFTSLLKSPFDFRRPSVDRNAEPAFIGGIKLEAEKQAAHQKLLYGDDSAIESDVHPALRKVKSDQRWSVPLKSPPPPPRGNPKNGNDPNRRAYPPITRMTAKTKTQPLVSPTAPAVPDLSIIEKWRARVGLKNSSKRASMDQKMMEDATKTAEIFASETPEPAIAITSEAKDGGRITCTRVIPTAPTETLDVPPEPPRRSSKRYSSSPSLSPKSTEHPCVPRQPFEPTDEQTQKEPSLSPSWENLQSSVMDTIEKNVRPMQQGERAFWNSREWAVDRISYPSQVPSSSSDDSASEGFNTISMPSTPNTSRPQSEKGFPHASREAEMHPLPRIELYDKSYASETCSIRSGSTFQRRHRHEQDQDPIQAAAMKVMAAFPDMPETKAVGGKVGTNSFENKEPYCDPLRLNGKRLESESRESTSHNSPQSEVLSRGLKGNDGSSDTSQPIAKVFVQCCGCKYYHDMPSKLYNAMVDPSVVLSPKDRTEFAGAISMTVKCPWCKHEMSKKCCAGMAAMVYIKERLH
jgi:hypothetical protein